MTNLNPDQRKDLIIESLRELVNEMQIILVRERKPLPTDFSTRKREFEALIHSVKNNEEISFAG